MAEVQGVPKENLEINTLEEESASKMQKHFEATRDAWRPTHLNYFRYDNFFKGNHYTYFDKKSGNLVDNTEGITVNISKKSINGVTNETLRSRLKWEFVPTDLKDEDSVKEAMLKGKLMDKYYFDILRIKYLLRPLLRGALKFSAMPICLDWDEDKNNGDGDVSITVENPFYFFPDPTAPSLSECKYIYRVVRRSINEIHNDEKYDPILRKKIVKEDKIGGTPIFESIMKTINLINEVPTGGSARDKDFDEAYVIERYKKVWEDQRVRLPNNDVISKKIPKIRKTCALQGKTLYDETTDLEDYPFEYLYSDKDENSLMGEGWMKDLIPLNMAINRAVTIIQEYNESNRPTIILPRGTKVKFTYQNGIRILRTSKMVDRVPSLDIPSLPPTVSQSIDLVRSFFEDIGNYHDVSAGRVPTGVKSGKAIELLKSADAVNTGELADNVADFLERVAKKIFWLNWKYNLNPQTVDYEQGEEKRRMMYMSKNSPFADNPDTNGASADDVLYVTAENNLRVSLESDIAYSEVVKKETLMELYNLKDEQGRPVLPLELLLTGYSFGNVKEVMEKLYIERDRQKREMMEEAMTEREMIASEDQNNMAESANLQADRTMRLNQLSNRVNQVDSMDERGLAEEFRRKLESGEIDINQITQQMQGGGMPSAVPVQ